MSVFFSFILLDHLINWNSILYSNQPLAAAHHICQLQTRIWKSLWRFIWGCVGRHFRKHHNVFVVSAWSITTTFNFTAEILSDSSFASSFSCLILHHLSKEVFGQKPKLHPSSPLSSIWGGRSHSGCTDLLVMCRLWWADICRRQLCSAWVCLCVPKSHCGQTYDDFWRNAVTVLRTSPQASQKQFPLWRYRLYLANKQRGENLTVPAESWSHSCLFMVFTLANPASDLGFTCRLNSLWPGPLIFPIMLI